MEGNNPSKGNTTDSSMASGPSASMSNTKLTSETLRLELREGEKQNHMQDGSVHQGATLANPALQKKKAPSFQITSVVYNVDGEESPDETEDMSDILDSSKMTDLDQETPSFSEEYSKSEDAGAPAAVIPTSSQYGITAVVQQNESGGLLTSRLPHGITVNVTKGGIALAEADGVVTSDTENLSNRFKIVKIASNKPFKKGRWVCFDFMDSPATSAVGIRNTESNHGVSIPLALISQGQVAHASQSQHPLQQQVSQLQQGLQLQTPQIQQQQFPISSQAGNTQQVSMPFTSQVPPQGYHSNVSNQPGSMSVQQVSQLSMQHQQQQHQQQQHQLQQHLQQQQLQQQIQQNQPSVLPIQVLENRQAVGASGQQPAINTNLSQSSPVAQGLSAVNIIQQQIQNQPQEQQLLQQATSQQSLQTQMHPQSVMTGQMAPGQQMTQQQMQPSSSHTQQQQFQSQINQQQQQQQQQLPQQSQQQQQQQMQHQIQQQMQQQQLQHQQSIPSQSIVVSQGPQGQDNLHLHKDPSPSAQPSNSCYQAIQQQQLQGSQQQQPMALSQQPTAQQLQQQQQGSSQVQHSQQNLTASPSAGQVSLGGSSMSTNLSSYPSVPGLSSVSNLSNINISKMITSHITAAEGTFSADSNEMAGEPGPSGGDDVGPGDEDKQSASTASTVAIDNKIEQAMDLVKSHLMFAVREEVDVLKERIGELMERINHLEYENTVLRKYATQEALQQIQQQQHGGAPNP